MSAQVIREPNPGDFVDIFGTTIFTNFCGAYRNLKYTLLDQHGETMSGVTVTEVLTNFQSDPQGITPPDAKTTETNSEGAFPDIVGAKYSAPCNSQPFSYTLKQGFTAKVGQTTYNLTTKNDIAISKSSSGQWTISITNTTP